MNGTTSLYFFAFFLILKQFSPSFDENP